MSVQLTADQELQLASLASADGRTPDDLAQDAVADFLANRTEGERDLLAAEEEADRDGWLTTEEVFSRLHQRISKAA